MRWWRSGRECCWRCQIPGCGSRAPAYTSPEQQARFAARFAPHGIGPERLEFAERTPTNREHLACYGEIDIALDTAPYNGTTTTCEALWMGVPTVTLAGDRHMARVSASLLTAAGHAEWVAPDAAGYVARAVALADNPVALAAIRAGLRDDLRRGPLLDAAGQAGRFGEALRETWLEWCRAQEAVLCVSP